MKEIVMEKESSTATVTRSRRRLGGENKTNGLEEEDHKIKVDVYNQVLRRLKKDDVHHTHSNFHQHHHQHEEDHPHPHPTTTNATSFDHQLWAHFNRLPTRYALDVNVERAEDVVTHKRLLQQARDPFNPRRPAFHVRLVHVSSDCSSCSPNHNLVQRMYQPPAFGSFPNLEALELKQSQLQDDEDTTPTNSCSNIITRPMHEITFSTDDKPKVLSQLTALLSEIGLNIQEVHAFSTMDGYSLVVFVVDGWPFEECEQLRTALLKALLKFENQFWPNPRQSSPFDEQEQLNFKCEFDHLSITNYGSDAWEIDPQHLKFGRRVASGTYGDLYKGTYCSQEVAIKVLKAEKVTAEVQKEFAQEVYIMRRVQHKNVVQFIGACTKPPSLCIVTEYMSGGSVYDYLHKQNGTFKLPSLLKVAIDISKGMNYLHHNNIIHRDLKAANLLMDENEVVKVADFGVARVKAQSGAMTAETGTYRWMAPEIIEHKTYDQKADIFSFGIVLWELLTGKLPYEYLTPVQAAIGVVQKGLRPTIPKKTLPKLAELLHRCWQQDPTLRPDFTEILLLLQQIADEVADEGEDRRNEKNFGGFFSALRRGRH